MVILLDEKKGVGLVPQRKERREQDKEKGKKEKEERGGGKSKARIGEIEDPKNRKKSPRSTLRRRRKEEEGRPTTGSPRRGDSDNSKCLNHQNAQKGNGTSPDHPRTPFILYAEF